GGGGISHALTGFNGCTVIHILIGVGVLQYGLAEVKADNPVGCVKMTDLSLAVNVTPSEKQDRASYDYSFHGSLCVKGKYVILTSTVQVNGWNSRRINPFSSQRTASGR